MKYSLVILTLVVNYALTSSSFTLLTNYDRDDLFYTQGLVFKNNKLIESAGGYGTSSIQWLTLNKSTNKIEISISQKNNQNIFAEGIDMPKTDYIYQLTWQSNSILSWDSSLTSKSPAFTSPNPAKIYEGWGLTSDPQDTEKLFYSDGSSYIYTISIPKPNVAPQILKQVRVIDTNGYALSQLNELEFIDGHIWANVYLSNRIVKINPDSGNVVKSYDLTSLEKDANQQLKARFGRYLYYGECLNGIAYDKDSSIWYITGKNWPRIYAVKFD
jgi:glutaminyl-peptide cyclotransferase